MLLRRPRQGPDAVEPAHERTYGQLIAQLRRSHGALVFASCADLSLRATIERRLADELAREDRAVEVLAWDEDPEAPWAAITAACERAGTSGIVSVHYDAIDSLDGELSDFGDDILLSPSTLLLDRLDEEDSGALLAAGFGVPCVEAARRGEGDATLQGLNAGYELPIRDGLNVVLWLQGPNPLETVRIGAPDLWARRTLVASFPTAEELVLRGAARLAGRRDGSQEAAIERLERSLGQPGLSDHKRLRSLELLIRYLGPAGRPRDQQARLEQMRRTYRTIPSLAADERHRARMLRSELLVATHQGDELRRRELLSRAKDDASIRVQMFATAERAALAEWVGTLDEALDRHTEGIDRCAAKGPTLRHHHEHYLDRSALYLRLGFPAQAERDADAVEKLVHGSWMMEVPLRNAALYRAEWRRASVARALGRPDEALDWAWRARYRCASVRAWEVLREVTQFITGLYAELGLPGVIREQRLAELKGLERFAGTEALRMSCHRELARLALSVGDRAAVVEHGQAALGAWSPLPGPTARARALVEFAALARELRVAFPEPEMLDGWRERLEAALEQDAPPWIHDPIRLEHARWEAAASNFAAAAAEAEACLPFRREHRGPLFIVEACVLAAQAHRGDGQLREAVRCLEWARMALAAAPEQAQPFSAWRELREEEAELHRAQGSHEDAWAALEPLIEQARRRGLEVEHARLLLRQARLELGSERAMDAALRSLRAVSRLGYLRDEGSARLVLAEHAEACGDHETTRQQLALARPLLDRLGPAEDAQQARSLATRLSSG